MTDRTRVLTVLLKDETRTDDVEPLMDAIRMLRGVAVVKLGEQTVEWCALETARMDLREKLWAIAKSDAKRERRRARR